MNGTSIILPFILDINLFAMYRRTLNDTEKTDYISAVKCLQSRPAFEPRAISAIQSRFDDFQALHIQVADRVHLTVNTKQITMSIIRRLSEITYRAISYPGTDIFCVSTKMRYERNVGTKGPLRKSFFFLRG